MVKVIAALGALLLSGSLVWQEPLYASEPSREEACAITDVGGVETPQTNADVGAIALGISNEEAVRREKICDELWRNCKAMCNNWKLKGDKLKECKKTCRANFDDCIADIH